MKWLQWSRVGLKQRSNVLKSPLQDCGWLGFVWISTNPRHTLFIFTDNLSTTFGLIPASGRSVEKIYSESKVRSVPQGNSVCG